MQTPVVGIYIPPQYDPKKHQGDISVLKVNATFPLDKPNCKEISLPLPATLPKPKADYQLNITGWGYKSNEEQNFTENLQLLSLMSVENDECKKKILDLSSDNACAKAKKGQCTSVGDRGDPAAFSNVEGSPILYGVTITWNFICDAPITETEPFYEVFTFVSNYSVWIFLVMDDTIPSTAATIL